MSRFLAVHSVSCQTRVRDGRGPLVHSKQSLANEWDDKRLSPENWLASGTAIKLPPRP